MATSAASSSLVPASRQAPAWIERWVRKLLDTVFQVEVRGFDRYPANAERLIVIANHVSLLDGLLLYLHLPERPCFMLNIGASRRFRFFLSFCDMFLIDPYNPMSLKSATRHVSDGRRLLIFPEGRITTTGALMKPYPGTAMIVELSGATVVPVAIDGLQYSWFSYLGGRLRRSLRPKVHLTMLEPVQFTAPPGSDGKTGQRRQQIFAKLEKLMREIAFQAWPHRRGLYPALMEALARHGAGTTIVRQPDNVKLSYRAMLTRAAGLARILQRKAGAESRIGILLPNVAALPVVFWALQRLGVVPAMLNYTAGAAGCLGACKVAGLNVVISSRAFVKKARLEELDEALRAHHKVLYLEELGAEINLVDRVAGLWHGLRPRVPASACREPDQTAVLLFTSGSEGIPKGVALSHANLLANYAQVRCQVDFNRADLAFCCLPIFHSFGLYAGLILPALGGFPVMLYPSPLDYRTIPELIYEHGATILFGADTFLRGYAKRAHPYDLHTLRFVAAGAEKLTRQTWQLWAERFSVCIYQGYGVTETSPVVAVNTPQASKTDSVGQLMPGMEYHLEPVAGIERGGRLMLRGPNVMQGYLRGESATPEPPSTAKGMGWYDTGDLAEFDEDGYLFILGRIKRFAKIGGEMIPLGTIEELAAECWPEACCAAIAMPDAKRGERVLLITDAKQVELAALRRHARARGHPDLYVPAAIEIIDEVPRLGTGKTDYRTLEQRFRPTGS